MSLKEFGLICLVAVVVTGGAIGFGAIFGEATRRGTQIRGCMKTCTPYVFEILQDECYCADAEGRYAKRLVPERSP